MVIKRYETGAACSGSGRVEGPRLVTQGSTWKDYFLASPCLKWCHLFDSLNSIASLKLILSILMSSKNVMSKVNAWIEAERKREVGGHMCLRHTHTWEVDREPQMTRSSEKYDVKENSCLPSLMNSSQGRLDRHRAYQTRVRPLAVSLGSLWW